MAIRFMKRKERPTPDAMTLTEHVGEVRRRIIIVAVTYVATATLAAIFYNQMLSFLLEPYCHVHARCNLYVTAPLDGLTLRIKMAMFGGLILAAPVILWQLWRFITPGLRPSEKRYIVPFVLAAVALFLAGCALAYLVLPHALRFLDAVGGPKLNELYNPIAYINLIMAMMLIFGVMFEFPVLLVALQLARVVSSAKLLSWWRWAIIVITVLAAVFTPSGDPLSMLVLAAPLICFYFMAIGIGKLLGR